jgi:uncharacterized protein YraI
MTSLRPSALSLVAVTLGAVVLSLPACSSGSATGASSGGSSASSSVGPSSSSTGSTGSTGGAGGANSSSVDSSTSVGSTSSSSSASGTGGASSSSSGAPPACTTLVTTADLNLRSGPGTTFSILDVIPDGSTVTLLDPTEQNGFENIAYQTETGWSSAMYLEPACSTSTSSSSSSSSSSSGATVWSCTGLYGTIPMANGEYYATEFGCYIDANGNPQQDPGDNCIPACLSQAQTSGLCAGMSGPDCEDAVSWYSADGGRFGCLARLKVTNEANGKAVVVVVLDYGPACSVEATVQHAAIDLSYPADHYLFGEETGISDEALVHVDVVDASTALGPVP